MDLLHPYCSALSAFYTKFYGSYYCIHSLMIPFVGYIEMPWLWQPCKSLFFRRRLCLCHQDKKWTKNEYIPYFVVLHPKSYSVSCCAILLQFTFIFHTSIKQTSDHFLAILCLCAFLFYDIYWVQHFVTYLCYSYILLCYIVR